MVPDVAAFAAANAALAVILGAEEPLVGAVAAANTGGFAMGVGTGTLAATADGCGAAETPLSGCFPTGAVTAGIGCVRAFRPPRAGVAMTMSRLTRDCSANSAAN